MDGAHLVRKLTELSELRAHGALSDEEFQAAKAAQLRSLQQDGSHQRPVSPGVEDGPAHPPVARWAPSRSDAVGEDPPRHATQEGVAPAGASVARGRRSALLVLLGVLVLGGTAVGVVVLTTSDTTPGVRPSAESRPTQAAGPDAATPEAAVDWPNASYRVTCDGIVPEGMAVQLQHGEATAYSVGGYDEVRVGWQARATGDLTGDGAPETAVLLSCLPQPSNIFVQEVQVLSADGGLLSVLPSPSTVDSSGALPPEYVPAEFAIRAGTLTTGMKFYGPGDSHASGPSIFETVLWQWDGAGFRPIT